MRKTNLVVWTVFTTSSISIINRKDNTLKERWKRS